jgi:hypothetical protein
MVAQSVQCSAILQPADVRHRCKGVQRGAKGCKGVQRGAKGCKGVQSGELWSKAVHNSEQCCREACG